MAQADQGQCAQSFTTDQSSGLKPKRTITGGMRPSVSFGEGDSAVLSMARNTANVPGLVIAAGTCEMRRSLGMVPVLSMARSTAALPGSARGLNAPHRREVTVMLAEVIRPAPSGHRRQLAVGGLHDVRARCRWRFLQRTVSQTPWPCMRLRFSVAHGRRPWRHRRWQCSAFAFSSAFFSCPVFFSLGRFFPAAAFSSWLALSFAWLCLPRAGFIFGSIFLLWLSRFSSRSCCSFSALSFSAFSCSMRLAFSASSAFFSSCCSLFSCSLSSLSNCFFCFCNRNLSVAQRLLWIWRWGGRWCGTV